MLADKEITHPFGFLERLSNIRRRLINIQEHSSCPGVPNKTVSDNTFDQNLTPAQHLVTLLENISDGIMIWDLSGRISYWSKSAEMMLGNADQEMLGSQVFETYLNQFQPPFILDALDEVGQSTLRKFIRPDGKQIWVRSRLALLSKPGEKGQTIGYMHILSDVSDQVRAEEALHKGVSGSQAVMEGEQNELVFHFKPNGHLTYINQAFCQYFDMEPKKLLGMNFLYFVPKGERINQIQHWASFNSEKTVAILEHPVFVPNKGICWLQRTDHAVLDQGGKIVEFQSVGRDITRQKKNQALNKTQEQPARTVIEKIAPELAHQIYNPLTTIIADAQILLQRDELDPVARESAEAIEQAGWRLQKVIQHLLGISESPVGLSEIFDQFDENEGAGSK